MTGNEFRSALGKLAIPQRRLGLWLATFGTTSSASHVQSVNRWATAGSDAVPDTAAAIIDLLRRLLQSTDGLPFKR